MLAKKPQGATAKRQGSPFASFLWMFVGAMLTLMIGAALYLFNPFETRSSSSDNDSTAVATSTTTAAEGDKPKDFEFYDLLPQQEITSIPDEAVVIETLPDDFSLEPDVIVTLPPENAQANDTDAKNEQNFGVASADELNPLASNEVNAASGDNSIEVVEETGTYDEVQASTANPTSQEKSEPAITYVLQIQSYTNAEEADRRRAQVLMAGVDAHVLKRVQDNGQTLYQVVSSPMQDQISVLSAQQNLQNNGIDSLIVEQRR